MGYFNNLKIGNRLTLTLAIFVSLVVIVGLLSLVNAGAVQENLDDIVQTRMVITEEMNELRLEVNEQALIVRNLALLANADKARAEREALAASRKVVTDVSARVDARITSPKGREIQAAIFEHRDKFRDGVDKVLLWLESGQREQAITYLTDSLRPVQIAYMEALDKQVGLQRELSTSEEEEAAEAVQALRVEVGTAIGVSLLIAIGLGMWIVQSITRPIAQAVALAQAVAAGDLTRQIAATSKDETGVLLQALAAMQESLTQVVGSVREGSDSVATASAQIAEGNQDLSSRTEKQASALEETAASMEELTSTVKQNADNARQGNLLAQSASSVAVQGGAVVSQVVETMQGISASSKKIADIIGVIDGIAFQTNILALNAAVEAARAGEQGRGFAVVAGEVRSLAGRSAEAAKDIKALISDSVGRVDAGTTLVNQAGTTMQSVVDSIRRVTDIMSEISAASTEQSQGVDQIGHAVQEMDHVTQQNAALVEEMAAAASSLNTQAQNLVGAVAVFRLNGASAVTMTHVSAPVVRAKAVAAPKRAPRLSVGNTRPTAAGARSEDWTSF